MGTEVHFDMQLPGYYSFTNLKGNSGDVGWRLPRGNGSLGPYNDFLPGLTMGYDKERMRQTIMKHDSIFRHQLRELHRLYRIQRDLMNEIKNIEGNKHLIPQVSSYSSPFSCGFRTKDERKRWQTSESHFSNFDCFRLSTSGANGTHSQFSSLKGNAPQSSYCLTQNGLKFKNCGSLESQHKIRTMLFDLECPAREYINNKDGACGVSATRNENITMHYDSNSNSNGEATSFDLNLKRTCGFTDLNEPIPVEKASTSACIGIPSNISCSKKEVQRNDLSSLSPLCVGFNQRGAEFFEEHGKARERRIGLINPDLEVERWHCGGFSNKFENGRKIFGVEIPANSNGASAVTSHGLDPLPVHSWSDAAPSEILSVSSRAKFYGNSSSTGSRTYDPLNSSSTEGLAPNDLFSASDCKEPRGCSQLVGLCNQTGISESKFAHHGPKFSFKSLRWMMEEKSTIDLNAGAMAADGYKNEEISRSDFVSVNGSIKQDSKEGLSWLRATRPSNAKPNKDVERSHQINLDSLQNCSQQFIDRTEMRIQDSLPTTHVDDLKHWDSDTGYSSSISKLLGFSISENVCRDLPSPPTSLKPSSPAYAIDGVDFDTTPDLLPRKCEQQCLVEGMVADKRSVNPDANVGHIDLNLSATDEGTDVQSTSSSVRTNVRIAYIDLEMPVNIEMRTKDKLYYESPENNFTRPSNLLHGEVDESQGFSSVSMAAEALIAISSSCVIDLHPNASSDKSEVSASDLLLWFAEIVTSCRSDTKNDDGSANVACLDDSIPDGIDIFEFMTLNLKETEVEECYKPQVQENKNGEDTLPRRPRRGQAKRGRQRKDFQRDVLPNLIILSRNEMTEDFHMIEGLIRAVGGCWQSSLTQKNNGKGKGTCRGRKREAGSSPPTAPKSEECWNQFQQTKTGVEQTSPSLTGWGKRSRRPPRPRCLMSSPLL